MQKLNFAEHCCHFLVIVVFRNGVSLSTASNASYGNLQKLIEIELGLFIFAGISSIVSCQARLSVQVMEPTKTVIATRRQFIVYIHALCDYNYYIPSKVHRILLESSRSIPADKNLSPLPHVPLLCTILYFRCCVGCLESR